MRFWKAIHNLLKTIYASAKYLCYLIMFVSWRLNVIDWINNAYWRNLSIFWNACAVSTTKTQRNLFLNIGLYKPSRYVFAIYALHLGSRFSSKWTYIMSYSHTTKCYRIFSKYDIIRMISSSSVMTANTKKNKCWCTWSEHDGL